MKQNQILTQAGWQSRKVGPSSAQEGVTFRMILSREATPSGSLLLKTVTIQSRPMHPHRPGRLQCSDPNCLLISVGFFSQFLQQDLTLNSSFLYRSGLPLWTFIMQSLDTYYEISFPFWALAVELYGRLFSGLLTSPPLLLVTGARILFQRCKSFCATLQLTSLASQVKPPTTAFEAHEIKPW